MRITKSVASSPRSSVRLGLGLVVVVGLASLRGSVGLSPFARGVRPDSRAPRGSAAAADDDAAATAVDVSDLGLTLDDLDAPLPPEVLRSVAASGHESTSRVATVNDGGCAWRETATEVEAVLTVPGLRGQPVASLAAEFGTTTATLTSFGMVVWSCVLRGAVVPELCTARFREGDDMVPVCELTAVKAIDGAPYPRWGGFIEQIGENSIL